MFYLLDSTLINIFLLLKLQHQTIQLKMHISFLMTLINKLNYFNLFFFI